MDSNNLAIECSSSASNARQNQAELGNLFRSLGMESLYIFVLRTGGNWTGNLCSCN